jgi:hypothetical protein
MTLLDCHGESGDGEIRSREYEGRPELNPADLRAGRLFRNLPRQGERSHFHRGGILLRVKSGQLRRSSFFVHAQGGTSLQS